jgi:hypothetical protein
MQTIPKTNAEIYKFDWNFDGVPDDELVACCYWEYARESAFIRRIKRRFAAQKAGEKFNAGLWRSYERIDSIGYAAEVFLLGFLVEEVESAKASRPDAPLITGSFPGPWQSLSKAERKYRSHIRSDSEVIGLVPFKYGGDIITAESLLESAKEYSKQYRKEADEAHLANPGYGETTLRRWGKYPKFDPKASVIWDDGIESAIVRIAWEQFTNEEIVEAFKNWVGPARPPGVGVANRRGQRKQKGYRDYLAWLGMMRLMNAHPFTSIKRARPDAWSHYRSADWPRARKKAIAVFKRLFPFLPPNAIPIHARTAGGRAA